MYKIKKSKSGILPILFGLMVTFFLACSEDERLTYIDKNAPAPATVDASTVLVENFAGGSMLRYKLPKDENLLSVKAVYETAPGVVRETEASRYTDSLVLRGYGQAGKYSVRLYSIGKNDKVSEPATITVSPLASPIYDAFETLDLNGMFGGVLGKLDNPDKATITAVLSADNTHNGNFTLLRSYVLGNAKSSFAYLGLPNKEAEFSVYLKDRWGNRTDTKTFTLTPLFEQEIEKPWKAYNLPSDRTTPAEPSYLFEYLWDNRNASWIYWWATIIFPLPLTFTIDLGEHVVLSRIVLHHPYDLPWFAQYTPKFYELWVSDLDAPGDDLFGGDWTHIATMESVIPSGKETPTKEDNDYAIYDGENMFILPTDEIQDPYVPCKYLRFRILKVWDQNRTETTVAIGELDLFGKVL